MSYSYSIIEKKNLILPSDLFIHYQKMERSVKIVLGSANNIAGLTIPKVQAIGINQYVALLLTKNVMASNIVQIVYQVIPSNFLLVQLIKINVPWMVKLKLISKKLKKNSNSRKPFQHSQLEKLHTVSIKYGTQQN